MKNTLKVDHENRRLIMDKTFAKLSSNVRNEEYDMLQKVRADYPNYTVTVRQIKKNPNKESYKGLTYAYMKNYINFVETTEENRAAALAEFEQLRLISACHSNSKRYPVIKNWFLEKYPEISQFGLPVIDIEMENATSVIEDSIDSEIKETIDVPSSTEATEEITDIPISTGTKEEIIDIPIAAQIEKDTATSEKEAAA